jgi:hypothetical protein
MFKTCLTIIKHFEEDLIKMKYEEMLHFLINDIVKYGFFQSSNIDKFLMIYNNLNIPNILILNLENEFYLDCKIKDQEEIENKNP